MARTPTGIVIALILCGVGCARDAGREYELRGQILTVDRAGHAVTIRHEDIPQFMPGMTMVFRVSKPALLDGRVPGDLVKATLVVRDTTAHLRTLEKTGFAPVPASEAVPAATALSPGDAVEDATFVDHSGATRRLGEFRGKALAVTFIYTRCPVPTFCPLIDRQFAAVQQEIHGSRLRDRVQLLSVSFDPRHDTPAVLAKHAAKVQADAAIWRFATGEPEDVDRFARQFGVSIMRESETDEEIVHNLRTAVIRPDGRLATILNGSDWTAAMLLTALEQAATDDAAR